MKRPWLNLEAVIAAQATLTVVYMLSILLDLPVEYIFGLCLVAMLALVWMVIRILKDPWSTDKTFDEQFYQDRDDLRRNGTE